MKVGFLFSWMKNTKGKCHQRRKIMREGAGVGGEHANRAVQGM